MDFAPPAPDEIESDDFTPPGPDEFEESEGEKLLASTGQKEQPVQQLSTWQALNTPITKMLGVDAAADEDFQRGQAEMLAIGRILTPEERAAADAQQPTAMKLIHGTARGVGELADSLTSPVGLLTLGVGGLPKVAQRILSGAFAVQAATQLPGQAKELKQAIDQGDADKAAQLFVEMGGGTAITALAGKHALTGEARAVPPIRPEPFVESEGRTTLAKPIVFGDLEDLAARARGIAPKTAEAATAVQPEVEPEPEEDNASSQQEAATVHGDVRAQPGEGEGEVPKQEGGERVQPQAEGGIPEGAEGDVLLKHAREVADHPSDQPFPKAWPTEDAVTAGAGLKTPEQMEELLRLTEKAQTELRAIPKDMKNINAINTAGMKLHWLNEAVEAATGVGGDQMKNTTIKKIVGENYKPPFPEYEEQRRALKNKPGEEGVTPPEPKAITVEVPNDIVNVSTEDLKRHYANFIKQTLDYGARGEQVPKSLTDAMGEAVDELNRRGVKFETPDQGKRQRPAPAQTPEQMHKAISDAFSQAFESLKAEGWEFDPKWGPLELVLKPEWRNQFMFMGSHPHPTKPGRTLYEYKNGVTRRYLRLDDEGQAYGYKGDAKTEAEKYPSLQLDKAIDRSFEGVEEMGATRETKYTPEFIEKRNEALLKAGIGVARNEGKDVLMSVPKEPEKTETSATPPAPVSPVEKLKAALQDTTLLKGKKKAEGIKANMIDLLTAARDDAPSEKSGKTDEPANKTIHIPDDGTFEVTNTKENIQRILDKTKKLNTSSGSNRPAKITTGSSRMDFRERDAALRKDADNAIKLYGGVENAIRTIEKQKSVTEDPDVREKAQRLASMLWAKRHVAVEDAEDAVKGSKEAVAEKERDANRRKPNRATARELKDWQESVTHAKEMLPYFKGGLARAQKKLAKAQADYEAFSNEMDRLYPPKEAAPEKPEEPPTPPEEPPAPPHIPMGGATPGYFEGGGPATSIKNARVDQERATRGLPPRMAPLKRSFGEVWDRAMASIDHDPQTQDRLIDELRQKPRALTDMEDALLLHRQVDLQNEYDRATRDLALAHDDGRTEDAEQERLRVAGLSDRLYDLYEIGTKAGTETGRGLNARKMMVNEDFSLAKMETQRRVAKGGAPLTDLERAEVKGQHDKIIELQKKLDDYVEREKTRRSDAAINQAIPDLKAEAQRDTTAARKAGKPNDPQSRAANFEARISGAADEGKPVTSLTNLVQRLARTFVQMGTTDRDLLIDRVHGVLQRYFPDITRRETMDAISGYGDFKQLSKDEISVQLRGMKGEMQQIAKLEDMAAGRPPKKTGLERRTPTDAERRLIKLVNDAKYRFQIPVEDPNTQLKSALDTLKTSLRNRTAELQERLRTGDFAKRPRRELQLDPEAQRLKAANERAKQDFQKALTLERLKNRTPFEKLQDTLVKWRRGFLLSGPTTLAKLTGAALARLTITPTEEAVGGGIGKLFPELAKRAPREGGFNAKAEAKALTEGFTTGLKDAADTLRTGKSELDVLYGKDRGLPNEAIDFFGNLHGALKSVTKRNEFARSFEKRTAWAIDQGIDVSDPLVQTRIAKEAYADANRSIFLQDNRVVKIWKGIQKMLAAKSAKTGKESPLGKAAVTAANVLVPIVRVPTNIVAETMQYATGAVTGSAKLAKAYRAGIESLPPEEADLIMRDLKKGSLGTAVMLLGYFAPKAVGGYYQQGERRKPGDVKAANIRVYGQDVPGYWAHNPLTETLQLGASIRRVADSKLNRTDTDKQGLPNGIIAGALGLVDEVPFVRETAETTKALNPHERGAFFGELGKSIIVPQALQWLAQQTDKNSQGRTVARKPHTIMQHIETGIPGLRQNVPRNPVQNP